nr:hypothetical protein [Microctonus hyperodae filamentous virus]
MDQLLTSLLLEYQLTKKINKNRIVQYCKKFPMFDVNKIKTIIDTLQNDEHFLRACDNLNLTYIKSVLLQQYASAI